MLYIALATVGYIINWIFLRKKVVEYEVVATFVYLIAFIFVQSFDILYVEYVAFFIIPFLRDFRKVKRLFFIFLVYILAEIAIGLFFEPVVSVFATFLTRFFPLVFVTFIKKDDVLIGSDEDHEQRVLRLIVVLELLVSGILLYRGRGIDAFVVSHQPVGANLSLVGILLAMDIAIRQGKGRDRHKIENIMYVLFFAALALRSGIRGYIIIILPCTFYAVASYLFSERKRKAGLVLSVLLSIVILSLSFLSKGRLATILSSLDTSVGYRDLENKFFFQSIKDANPLHWVFGYGIGARGERIGSGLLIRALSGDSAYYTNHLTNGSVLLNFWLTVIKDMGIVGLFMYLTLYIKLIPARIGRTTERRNGWILYAVLYAFMLCYRTSCTNGMLEFFIFALLINNMIFSGEYTLQEARKNE